MVLSFKCSVKSRIRASFNQFNIQYFRRIRFQSRTRFCESGNSDLVYENFVCFNTFLKTLPNILKQQYKL